MDDSKPKKNFIIDIIAIAALIIGTIANSAVDYEIGSMSEFELFEQISMNIEAIAFILSAILMLVYLRNNRNNIYRALCLLILAGVISGFIYWVLLGLDPDNEEIPLLDMIIIFGLPNLISIIVCVIIIIPKETIIMCKVKRTFAIASAVLWTFYGLLVTILGIWNIIDFEAGTDKWYDLFSFLFYVGLALVIIVFAITICDRYPEPKEDENV